MKINYFLNPNEIEESAKQQIDNMPKNKTKKVKIKAWAVLDVDGDIRHPEISVFGSKLSAKEEAEKLNKLPIPTGDKKAMAFFGGLNKVVPIIITYEI